MTAPFLGSTSGISRQRLRAKRYTRLGHDVYVLADAEQDLTARVSAARLVFPEATVCLWTAALVLKLPVDDDGVVHLDRGKGAARSERDGIRVHRLAIPAERVHTMPDGTPVADGPRLLADLSAHLDLEPLVALGDQVLRRWKRAEVDAAADAHGSRRGAVLLRRALPLLDAGADSPAETRARLRLHAAGFSSLVHKVVVRDSAGGWLGAPDLADPAAKVSVQHEGLVHFEKGADQRRKDVDRDEQVRREGWEVVVSTAIDDVQPSRLVDKVTRAYLRQAQLLGTHVLPPHLRCAAPHVAEGREMAR